MFVNIQIRSKNKNSLRQYLKLLYKISNSQKLQLELNLKSFKSKIQSRVFTILKSPHVNKTSQEQFEYNIRTNKLKIKSLQFFKLFLIIKKLQKTTSFDIDVIFKFMINRKIYQKKMINCFKFDNYRLNQYEKKEFTIKYLRFFELHGISTV